MPRQCGVELGGGRTRSPRTALAYGRCCGTSCGRRCSGCLLVAAVASYFVGERSDAVIIGVIVALSVGLGFVNEYRAEKAAEALHDQIRHQTVVLRERPGAGRRRDRAGARRHGRAAPR